MMALPTKVQEMADMIERFGNNVEVEVSESSQIEMTFYHVKWRSVEQSLYLRTSGVVSFSKYNGRLRFGGGRLFSAASGTNKKIKTYRDARIVVMVYTSKPQEATS